jgi:cytoskeletal protein CcmA (bactofilin family)
LWKSTQPNLLALQPEPESLVPSPSTTAIEKPASSSSPVAASSFDQSTIGKSLVIKGEVTGSESLYIDGRVEGSISLAGNRVTVGRSSVVSANITASEIVILGSVSGNLVATERADIRCDGSLTGDIVASRLAVEEGAVFKGHIDIRNPTQPDQSGNDRNQERG